MILNYIQGNLFDTADECIAHCVSADLKLGLGIAKEVKSRYPLLPMHAKIGKAYGMYNENMLVYHLVTKRFYYGKPTYETLKEALISMKEQLGDIKEISIPKIGCGLDKLHWPFVEKLILDIFASTNVVITVYSL